MSDTVSHLALFEYTYQYMKRSTPLLMFFLLLVISAILSVLLWTGRIWFVYPDRHLYPVRGIDVSHHQGAINWSRVSKDDVAFAYIKATEADDFKDEAFTRNWEGAQKNNVKRGAYHFYSPSYSGAVQAENFIATVPTTSEQLPPVIDLEDFGNNPSQEQFNTDLHDYIAIVSKQYGTQPILYTTYTFYERYLRTEFSGYPLWIRDIYANPNSKKINAWTLWQYNPRGHVHGITGFVDLNVFNGKSLQGI